MKFECMQHIEVSNFSILPYFITILPSSYSYIRESMNFYTNYIPDIVSGSSKYVSVVSFDGFG